MTYSPVDLAWLFLIYSFIGWCIEVCYAAVRRRQFINRGFINSPLCPIYGVGAVLFALFLPELAGRPFFLFLGGTVLATVLEYSTGMLMEKFLGKKLWDYSGNKYNIGGYVCLRYSLLWGVLAVVTVLFTNALFCRLLGLIPHLIAVISLWIAAVVWLKIIYPVLSRWIEKIPKRTGTILFNILIVFMLFNMAVSSLALARYNERHAADSGAAVETSALDRLLDSRFDDERMERIYPNAKLVE